MRADSNPVPPILVMNNYVFLQNAHLIKCQSAPIACSVPVWRVSPFTARHRPFRAVSSTAARSCSTARCPLHASYYGKVLRQCECLTVQTPHLLTLYCTLCTAHQGGREQCKGAVSALVLSHSSVCCERSAGPGSAVQCKPVKCTLQMTKFAVQTLWIRYIAEHPCVVCKWLQFSNGPPSPIRGNSKPSATRNLA